MAKGPFSDFRAEESGGVWSVTALNEATGQRVYVADSLDSKTAHLFTAAPDLLEALEYTLDWMEAKFQDRWGNYKDPDVLELNKTVRVALAKAKEGSA